MDLSVGVSVAAVVLVALVVVTLAIGINIVPQGHVYTVQRFGKYHRSLESGLGLIAPYIERIGRRVNVMEQVMTFRARRPSPATMPGCASTRWCSTRCSTRRAPPTRSRSSKSR